MLTCCICWPLDDTYSLLVLSSLTLLNQPSERNGSDEFFWLVIGLLYNLFQVKENLVTSPFSFPQASSTHIPRARASPTTEQGDFQHFSHVQKRSRVCIPSWLPAQGLTHLGDDSRICNSVVQGACCLFLSPFFGSNVYLCINDTIISLHWIFWNVFLIMISNSNNYAYKYLSA